MSQKGVVITYQGAFSPPTLGHKDGASKLINAAKKLYPDSPITFLFMPSNDAESKRSLKKDTTVNDQYMSFEERENCLEKIVATLKEEYTGVDIQVSNIEQEFAKGPFADFPITSKTICTLMVLHLLTFQTPIIYKPFYK
jgi:nicotinic acid mononucleotide adenylyltransferase